MTKSSRSFPDHPKAASKNFRDFIKKHFVDLLQNFPTFSFLLGGLPLPFEVETSIMMRRFVSSAVGKMCKIRTDKLRELA